MPSRFDNHLSYVYHQVHHPSPLCFFWPSVRRLQHDFGSHDVTSSLASVAEKSVIAEGGDVGRPVGAEPNTDGAFGAGLHFHGSDGVDSVTGPDE